MNQFNLIVPAAGIGHRSGLMIPKQFVHLRGATVVRRSIEAFLAFRELAEIVVPVHEEWMDPERNGLGGMERVTIVPGGSDRQGSIRKGLSCIDQHVPITLVHDAARPFVSRSVIQAVLDGVKSHGAAIPAVPVRETIKRIQEDRIVKTERRDEFVLAQTPQGFRTDILVEAYERAESDGIRGTDDATLVERLGRDVRVVPGDHLNIKLTFEEDFRLAESLLELSRDVDGGA